MTIVEFYSTRRLLSCLLTCFACCACCPCCACCGAPLVVPAVLAACCLLARLRGRLLAHLLFAYLLGFLCVYLLDMLNLSCLIPAVPSLQLDFSCLTFCTTCSFILYINTYTQYFLYIYIFIWILSTAY